MSQRSFRRSRERDRRRALRRAALGAGITAAIAAPAAQADTYPVSNTADDGAGSLRAAVALANGHPGADVVDATAVSGTIRLTTGEIAITDGVTINGPGRAALTVSGDANSSGAPDAGDSRIFNSDDAIAGQLVAIAGMTLTNGYAAADDPFGYSGGAITNSYADLSLNDVVVSSSFAAGGGGGVSSGPGGGPTGDSEVTITDSVIRDNLAQDSTGGLGASAGSISVSGTTISGNRAIPEPGPSSLGAFVGGASLKAETVRVTDTSVTGNSAEYGGGLSVEAYVDGTGDATATLDGVSVTGNTAREDYAGGADVSAYIFEGYYGLGGKENVTVSDSVFSNNSSKDGVGGLDVSSGDLIDSTVSGNSSQGAVGGADISNGFVSGSTISGNTGTTGGLRIYGDRDSFQGDRPRAGLVSDSTISGNDSNSKFINYGNGFFTGGYAGGIAAFGELVSVESSTVVDNTADRYQAGIFAYDRDSQDDSGTDDTITVSSSIVTGNTVSGGPQDLGATEFAGYLSGSFELASSMTGPLKGAPVTQTGGPNLIDVQPELGPLADNGGPTRTHLPAQSSPAIGAGVANGLAVDQRRLPRTVGDGTDIGAVEVQDPDEALEGAKVKAKGKQAIKGKVKVVVSAGAAEPTTVDASGSIAVPGGKGKRAAAIKLKPLSREAAAGKTLKLALKPASKRSSKKILAALKKGTKVSAKLEVALTDRARNEQTKRLSVRLVAKKPR